MIQTQMFKWIIPDQEAIFKRLHLASPRNEVRITSAPSLDNTYKTFGMSPAVYSWGNAQRAGEDHANIVFIKRTTISLSAEESRSSSERLFKRLRPPKIQLRNALLRIALLCPNSAKPGIGSGRGNLRGGPCGPPQRAHPRAPGGSGGGASAVFLWNVRNRGRRRGYISV